MTLKTPLLYGLAGAAFLGIFFLNAPFPLIVAGAALIGYLVARTAPEQVGLKGGDIVTALDDQVGSVDEPRSRTRGEAVSRLLSRRVRRRLEEAGRHERRSTWLAHRRWTGR